MSKSFSSLPGWGQAVCIVGVVVVGLFAWRSCNSLEERQVDDVLNEVEGEARPVMESLSTHEDDFFGYETEEPSTVDCDEATPLAPGDNVRAYYRYLVELADHIPEQVERIDEALKENGFVQAEVGAPRDEWDSDLDDERELRPFLFEYSHPDEHTYPEIRFSGNPNDRIEITFYSECFREG